MAGQLSTAAPSHPLLVLLDLSRRARAAGSAPELAFLLVNDTHALAPYRQGGLWFFDSGIEALSGVVEPETNAPYAQWLDRTCRFLCETQPAATTIDVQSLPSELAYEWREWLPPQGIWLPFAGQTGGLLLAADQPWPDEKIALLAEWIDTWHFAWTKRARPAPWTWRRLTHGTAAALTPNLALPWWRQRRLQLCAAIVAVLLCPVRLSVLAPGELVPAHPAVIRAPLDGVIAQFQVQPNQVVKAGQPLFAFDEAPIAARRDVAMQALATAQAEYRQYEQLALSDSKFKTQLAIASGKIGEKQAEADFAREQFEHARVVAPQDGVALFDDPTEWIGKPVQTGERILRIAAPDDVEVEAWLPIGDAIPLAADADVKLYLASAPLSSLSARVRYVAHDAVPRPDGSYAYRVRARLDGDAEQRVGLKGTAKLSGSWVPLGYWMLRRPVAAIRQHIGI